MEKRVSAFKCQVCLGRVPCVESWGGRGVCRVQAFETWWGKEKPLPQEGVIVITGEKGRKLSHEEIQGSSL